MIATTPGIERPASESGIHGRHEEQRNFIITTRAINRGFNHYGTRQQYGLMPCPMTVYVLCGGASPRSSS